MNSFIKLITTKSGFDFQSYLQQHKMQIVLIASYEIYLEKENLINMNNRNRHIMRAAQKDILFLEQRNYIKVLLIFVFTSLPQVLYLLFMQQCIVSTAYK